MTYLCKYRKVFAGVSSGILSVSLDTTQILQSFNPMTASSLSEQLSATTIPWQKQDLQQEAQKPPSGWYHLNCLEPIIQ